MPLPFLLPPRSVALHALELSNSSGSRENFGKVPVANICGFSFNSDLMRFNGT